MIRIEIANDGIVYIIRHTRRIITSSLLRVIDNDDIPSNLQFKVIYEAGKPQGGHFERLSRQTNTGISVAPFRPENALCMLQHTI